MFKRKKNHECWMDITAVDHEEIDGRKYTHVLKICPECKDCDVETLAGEWELEQLQPATQRLSSQETRSLRFPCEATGYLFKLIGLNYGNDKRIHR